MKMQCTHTGCGKRTVARRLCRAHYQAAWKSGELGQHVKLPPRAKNPTVCPPEHKHAGSLVCYNLHQCRCSDCSTHRMATEARRRKDKAYGRYDTGLVDADPVRAHVLALGEYGIGYKRVAELAGVGVTGVRTLVWGRQDKGDRFGEIPKRIAREKAEKILAVEATIANLGARRSVPARGTHRRIQALATRGWSLSKLAHQLGWLPANFHTMMRRDAVAAGTARAVVELYDQLWNVEPPRAEWHDKVAYVRTVRFAAERRWLPPLAWDDIDLDEEPPTPDTDDGVDEMAIVLAIGGERVRLTPAERRECVSRLHAARWSDQRIAATLHCADKTVLRIRGELGLAAFDQSELVQNGAAA